MQITADHKKIRVWAQSHHGLPELIYEESAKNADVGIRINFPGKGDEAFFSEDKLPQETDWNEFFKIFDDLDLAFEYEEEPTGDVSNAYRFIPRENQNSSA